MKEKIYQNLIAQLDRLAVHNRQGSYQTRRRYYEAMKRFCKFLAETYHVERLVNTAPKHIFRSLSFTIDRMYRIQRANIP